jgi:hypothetical protein
MPARIALFSTGRMGTPIGAGFLRAGDDPGLRNLTPEKAAEPAARSALQPATPNEVAYGRPAEKGFRCLGALVPPGAAEAADELATYIRSAEDYSRAGTALQGRI